MRIDDALVWAVKELEGGESPSVDAKVLLANVIGKDATYLFTWPDKTLEQQALERFKQAIERRRLGEPVAYITGKRDFWTLTLATSPHTLIPRPDTEVLVEQVLNRLPQVNKVKKGNDACFSICDLGTGTGAIALALATELPRASVTGVDFKQEAVELAKHNAALNRISNATFIQSDWFTALNNMQFDVIVSNPPYIEDSSIYLKKGDVQFEPKTALTSGADGLRDIRHIINKSQSYLADGGLIAFEHGFNQGASVRALLLQADFIDVETVKDYGGNDRVTLGFRPF